MSELRVNCKLLEASICVAVQSLSHVQHFVTPWTAARQTSLSFTISPSLFKFIYRVSGAIQPSHPLSPLLSLPSIFPSIRVFSNKSVLHIRWPKYWNFGLSISLSNKYSGLISLRIDWVCSPCCLGTLKSLLQHHSSEASILVLSFLYSPILTSIHDHWKNHSLD